MGTRCPSRASGSIAKKALRPHKRRNKTASLSHKSATSSTGKKTDSGQSRCPLPPLSPRLELSALFFLSALQELRGQEKLRHVAREPQGHAEEDGDGEAPNTLRLPQTQERRRPANRGSSGTLQVPYGRTMNIVVIMFSPRQPPKTSFLAQPSRLSRAVPGQRGNDHARCTWRTRESTRAICWQLMKVR